MRYFNLPSLSIEPSPHLPAAGECESSPLPESDQTYPAQEHPPSDVATTATASMKPRKERISVFSMLVRLHASFARAEAVHQARLDDFWAGPERHMLAHYTYSAK
ncbi:hypothetical protein J2M53_05185 [Arthrobacter sp. zg-ZUI100]|uniref:hypothetical protein n=1 Tax=Arthrobacter jiangjiafuii TaxID=2817475 RepID=UPI001AEF2A84|nr:hypothetical protein [Arthrobacter jiangjiafuii]MBP3035652.1 hypothetical protein [Arthrobacter jiangjiafuii]